MVFLPASSGRTFAVLMASAIFLIGLGYLAFLPPFGSLDETAHYSSIRQSAQGGGIPVLGRSYIDGEVIEYRSKAPMPYRLPISHTTRAPTYGEDIITYEAFSASADLLADYVRHYRTAQPRATYVAKTEELNWAAQHPPLYYILMAPVMKATDFLPFVTQFFVLRLASFALAVTGFLIAAVATYQYNDKTLPKNFVLMAFSFFPFIAPMFFVEFGRIGNDSLCLFLMGISWACLLAWLKDESKLIYAAAIGLCFALGLLTKAFFVPFLAGLVLFIVFRILRGEDDKKANRLQALGIVLSMALIGGGWWYVVRYMETGAISGSLDAVVLQQQGGLIQNLRNTFSLAVFLEKILQVFRTWLWGDPAFPAFLLAPLFLLALGLFVEYLRTIKTHSFASYRWLPLWLIAPFLAGLVWHILVCIATQTNITPGWYLHVAAPALALAMAYGLRLMCATYEKRIFLIAALFYAIPFLVFAFWSQASQFAGCAVPGPDMSYKFRDSVFCLSHISNIFANLSVLGWPYLSAAAFAGGFTSLLLGAGMMRKMIRYEN